MTLTKLNYFLEVARTLNFTKAAENLFMAQPNLSKHIAQMEEEIGVKLFIRTKRSVELSGPGKLLLQELDGIPQQIENAFEQARAMNRGESGRISLGVLEGQEFDHRILEKIQQFSNDFPGVEIVLGRNCFSNLRNGLANGFYDAIITLCFDIESEADINYCPILSQSGGAIAINRNNPLASKEGLSLTDLTEENFVVISPEESPLGYKRFLEECASFGFTPKIARKLKSIESLLLSVETGLGVALLDHNTRLEKNSDVLIISIPDSPSSDLGLAWRCNDSKAVVTALVEALKI